MQYKGPICDGAQLRTFEKGMVMNRLAFRKPPPVAYGWEAGRNRGREPSLEAVETI